MAGSAVSRRVSEFVGVALFALALIWLIALASYNAGRPGLVLQHRVAICAPANFAGRVGAFIGRAVVPAARLRGLPDPARARGHRLALLLVPRDRRGLHQS